MDNLEFKPEMFMLINGGSTDAARSAKEANDIFNKWLKDAVVVYSCKLHPKMACNMWSNDNHPQAHNTHKALLINIEPIVKQPCNHRPSSGVTSEVYCFDCGVELTAEWKEKGSINE